MFVQKPICFIKFRIRKMYDMLHINKENQFFHILTMQLDEQIKKILKVDILH